jgi:thiol-disulfide isomerase/thioredoxin
VRVPSNMIPLGSKAPEFKLIDTISNNLIALSDIKSDIATVIMFICNHCPYVIHIQSELVKLANEYVQKKITFIAINSNDVDSYPEDAPDKMRERALELGFTFPYLFDATQKIAAAYHAACTPDFYIFDQALKCVYRGQFDESTPGNKLPITGKPIRQALDALLAGKTVDPHQKASVGCNIKWRKN